MTAAPSTTRLADAICMDQLPEALSQLQRLRDLDIVVGWIDDVDPVLYVAHRQNGMVRGATAHVEDGELHVYSETQAPPFGRCPPEVIEELDPSLDVKAITWRRDCLMRHHREMAINARLGTPPWVAYYSQAPLAHLQSAAHIATVARSHNGRASLAVTDGERHLVLEDFQGGPPPLSPLPRLEWWHHKETLLAAKGRSTLRYLGLGPIEYRVGLLFNDDGGLLAWSAAAQDCQVMAHLAEAKEDVFTPRLLLEQLDGWLGRTSVTENDAQPPKVGRC